MSRTARALGELALRAPERGNDRVDAVQEVAVQLAASSGWAAASRTTPRTRREDPSERPSARQSLPLDPVGSCLGGHACDPGLRRRSAAQPPAPGEPRALDAVVQVVQL